MQYFHGAASESKLQVKVWLIAYRVDFWLMSCSSVPYSLLLTASNKYLQTESGDFKANEHNNTMSKLWCYGKYWQHLTTSYMDTKAWSKVTDPTCSDTRKGEATLANRNLNWEKHHLPTLGILLVEPDRKKTLNWSKRSVFLQNARFTVRLLWHESARVETDNFQTFSLVEKAHVTIKRKIRMCWSHGLPWELLETKWLTNTEDCSYLPLATSDSTSPKPKMNWKLIKTLERGWYQVLLTPAYD